MSRVHQGYLLLWLLLAQVAMAANPVLWVTVEPNGWVADVCISGMTTGGTYLYGLGASNTLTGSESLRVSLTSPGWTDSGTATNFPRTVVGTKRMRLPYPNQLSANESANGGDVIVRIALSDYVHSTDTITAVNVASGLYVAGGATNSATTVGTVTNSSTVTVPRALAMWALDPRCAMPFETVSNSYKLAVTPWHYSVQDGRPVRAVAFWAVDSLGNRTPTNWATSLTLCATNTAGDVTTGDAVSVMQYEATIDGSGLAQGSIVSNYAKIYPWYGPVLDFSDGVNGPSSPDYGPLITYCDRLGTWPKIYAIVDPSGNTSGVAVTNLLSATNGAAKPFATIAQALNACGDTNNSLFGSNTLGNCFVLLTNGNYTWLGGENVSDRVDPKPWTVVKARPDVTWRNCVITGANNASTGQKGLRMKAENLTFSWSANASIITRGYSCVWVHSCLVGTNIQSSAALFNNATNELMTWTHIKQHRYWDIGSAFTADFAIKMRGNTFDGFAGGGNTAYLHPNLFIGNNVKPYTSEQYALVNDSTFLIDPGIWAFNRLMHQDAAVYAVTIGINNNLSKGFVVAQNVIEPTANIGSSIPLDIMNSQLNNEYCTNMLMWNNTVVGSYHPPYNLGGHLNVTLDHYQDINNLAARDVLADIHDFNGANGNDTNRWTLVYSVGQLGNASFSSSSGTDSGPVGYELGFEGLGGMYITTTNIGHASFVSNAGAVGGTASGNGDYRIQTNSPIYVASRTLVLPYDLNGLARSTNSPAGAYLAIGESNVAPTNEPPVVIPTNNSAVLMRDVRVGNFIIR